MKEAIRGTKEQLKFEPIVENKKKLKKYKQFLICGMGGSHLAADLIKSQKGGEAIEIHHDYGLPELDYKKRLVIISSYSGNTEEAIDNFKKALSRKLALAAVSTGGELLELAEKRAVPYIRIPDTGIEPRSALGFGTVCLLKLMGRSLAEFKKISQVLDMDELEKSGKELSDRLAGKIPIIYATTPNGALAYNWKIRFNETGKVPSFWHTFPELNHNEIVGFDREGETKKLSENFYFIFLKDDKDHPRNILRMEITKETLEKKGLPVEILNLKGKTGFEKAFSSLSLADWAAFYLAGHYGLKARETEIIARFKADLKVR